LRQYSEAPRINRIIIKMMESEIVDVKSTANVVGAGRQYFVPAMFIYVFIMMRLTNTSDMVATAELIRMTIAVNLDICFIFFAVSTC
jgi:hypothetical protein